MDLKSLRDHLRRGGAATLNHPAVYAVAEGAIVAPARYAGRNGSEFVFETRYVDGAFQRTALIDSKQSQSNRAEDGLLAARRDGGAAANVPSVEVAYDGREALSDIQLPHRIFDAHVRFGIQDGEPVVEQAWYRAVRDATHADLTPLFLTSPVTLVYGGWDSSRKSGQVRLRGLFVSELFGIVDVAQERLSRRSGARLDPLGQDFHVSPAEFEALLEHQRPHLSDNLVKKLSNELTAARKKKLETLSAAALGLGGVPPGTDSAYGVAVPEVRRARTISLAGFRRLRFGGTANEDVAARAALLGVLLLSAAYADADPELRAYCDVSAPAARTLLDDQEVPLDLSIETCEAFLAESVSALPDRLAWTGQVRAIVGDEALNRGAVAAAAVDGED